MNGRLFLNVLEYDELASTNSEAKLLLPNLKGSNFLLWARRQTEGRGQRGNTWFSGAYKDVAMTLVFRPTNLLVEHQFMLNVMVCNAVREFVASHVMEKKVEVKWPNDVLINEKKVCGILIENSIRGVDIDSSVIGVGLNVNSMEFPLKLGNVTSLLIENPLLELSQRESVFQLASFVEKEFLEWNENEAMRKYLNHLLGYNKLRKFKKDNIEFEGLVRGVESDGKLIMLCEEGEKKFDFKEVEFVYGETLN